MSASPARSARRRVSPLLAAPALLCLVAGGLLGAWGWTQRDESRARIIETPSTVAMNGGSASIPFDPSIVDPTYQQVPSDDYRVQTCEVLQAAARLQVPAGYEAPPTSRTTAPSSTRPGASTTVPEGTGPGWAIVAALDLDRVSGIPSLDQPDVLRAMDREREALEAALRDGREWARDSTVRSTAYQLETALQPYCA